MKILFAVERPEKGLAIQPTPLVECGQGHWTHLSIFGKALSAQEVDRLLGQLDRHADPHIHRCIEKLGGNRLIGDFIQFHLVPEVTTVNGLSLVQSQGGNVELGIAPFRNSKLGLPAWIVWIVAVSPLQADYFYERIVEDAHVYLAFM
jgi:hypothetical protein